MYLSGAFRSIIPPPLHTHTHTPPPILLHKLTQAMNLTFICGLMSWPLLVMSWCLMSSDVIWHIRGQVVTNAEAWFNNSLRPRKPEGSLGRTAQDVHLDSHNSSWTMFYLWFDELTFTCGLIKWLLMNWFLLVFQWTDFDLHFNELTYTCTSMSNLLTCGSISWLRFALHWAVFDLFVWLIDWWSLI